MEFGSVISFPGDVMSRNGFVAVVIGSKDENYYVSLGKRSVGAIPISVISYCKLVWSHKSV